MGVRRTTTVKSIQELGDAAESSSNGISSGRVTADSSPRSPRSPSRMFRFGQFGMILNKSAPKF